MMEYFIFDFNNSKDLGLIIKDMPLVPQAERNIESIEVNGRNGNLHIDNGNYKSKPYTITCIAKDLTKIDDICKLITGTAKLSLSKYIDRFFIATVKNQISFKSYGNYLQEFPIQFELEPIAYSQSCNAKTFTENGNVYLGGNIDVPLEINVTGTGKFTINNYSVEVLESGIKIDSSLMNCTKNNLSKNDKVILDEFPRLNPGLNNFTLGEGIEKLDILFREGWI